MKWDVQRSSHEWDDVYFGNERHIMQCACRIVRPLAGGAERWSVIGSF